MSLEATLRQGAADLGLTLLDEQFTKLLSYLELVGKWNKVYNLTAVRGPHEMLSHHLLDSLAVVRPLQAQLQGRAASLLDVGSGAGLPGVVLAICCPQWQVDCVDTVAKKAAFIQQAALTLALPNLRGIHDRVENLSGPYDVITSRAFASLRDFVSWSASALSPAGIWMAMKGKTPAAEMAELPRETAVFHVEQIRVPQLKAERCIVWLHRVPSSP